jgi:hypothetical protein
MRLFLVVFFLVYGGVHAYAFLKARAAFGFGFRTGLLVALFMLLMVLAPVIVRVSEKEGFELFARVASYAGYLWMGVLFLFFSASLCVDIYRLAVFLGAVVLQKSPAAVMPSARLSFLIPLGISLAVTVYGYFEAKDVRTERIAIKSPKIPAAAGTFTIAQISDVHLGLIVRESRLQRMLDQVKKADPDILISTGDLVDGQINDLTQLIEPLRGITPRLGKFAITGNHEFYAGLPQALDFTEKAGFTILRNGSAEIADAFIIAGIDDETVRYYNGMREETEQRLLVSLPRDRFILFLKHRPLVETGSLGLFDLQLSGHVHKGQIFPFSLLTRLHYPVYAGFAALRNGSSLYVNRGSGTWGPPIRVLAPPEVTIIELVHDEERGASDGELR